VYLVGFGIWDKCAKPSLEHWIAVKHIFQYLQGTLQFKLQFGGIPLQEMVGYCDVDWINDLEFNRGYGDECAYQSIIKRMT
jgi:hypothetical protein